MLSPRIEFGPPACQARTPESSRYNRNLFSEAGYGGKPSWEENSGRIRSAKANDEGQRQSTVGFYIVNVDFVDIDLV
jgi:hypothetical protein